MLPLLLSSLPPAMKAIHAEPALNQARRRCGEQNTALAVSQRRPVHFAQKPLLELSRFIQTSKIQGSASKPSGRSPDLLSILNPRAIGQKDLKPALQLLLHSAIRQQIARRSSKRCFCCLISGSQPQHVRSWFQLAAVFPLPDTTAIGKCSKEE